MNDFFSPFGDHIQNSLSFVAFDLLCYRMSIPVCVCVCALLDINERGYPWDLLK